MIEYDDSIMFQVSVMAEPDRFCKKCNYDLRGLASARCPECGRVFDPENPRTYLRRPRRAGLRLWLKRAAWLTLSGLLLFTLTIGWIFWGWHQEQVLIAEYGLQSSGPSLFVGSKEYYKSSLLPDSFLRWWYGPPSPQVCINQPPAPGPIPPSLSAEFCIILDGSIPILNIFERIDSLNLDQSPESVRLADHLADFQHLRYLAVRNTPLKDVSFLDKAPNLTDLTLDSLPLTDLDFSALGRLNKMERLEISQTKISDATIQFIGQMPNLVSLSLSDTNISDEGLRFIGQCRRLKYLYFNGTKISGDGLRHLLPCTKLEVITLCDTSVSDAGVKHLLVCKNLITIHLENTSVTIAGVEALTALTKVQAICIANCPKITEDEKEAFKRRHPNINTEIKRIYDISD